MLPGLMSGAQRGLVFELLQPSQILLSFQGDAVSDDEWDRYIHFMSSLTQLPALRILVCVEGSPPSAANQRRISEVVRGRAWKVALVSSSTALRFVVSAFSLINRTIRYFPPEELQRALDHIDCSPDERREVALALERLKNG
jgi:hypothetical protein